MTTGNRSASHREVLAAGGLMSIGILLVANPLWFATALIYPGVVWTFAPLFHAMTTAFGLIVLYSGLETIGIVGGTPSRTTSMVAGVIIAIFVPMYGTMVALLQFGTPLGYGARRFFVAAVIVTFFLLGRSIGSRDRRLGWFAATIPIVPLTLVILDWSTGAILGPIVDGYFLITGAPLFGIPYLGTVTLLTTLGFGVLTGRSAVGRIE